MSLPNGTRMTAEDRMVSAGMRASCSHDRIVSGVCVDCAKDAALEQRELMAERISGIPRKFVARPVRRARRLREKPIRPVAMTDAQKRRRRTALPAGNTFLIPMRRSIEMYAMGGGVVIAQTIERSTGGPAEHAVSYTDWAG